MHISNVVFVESKEKAIPQFLHFTSATIVGIKRCIQIKYEKWKRKHLTTTESCLLNFCTRHVGSLIIESMKPNNDTRNHNIEILNKLYISSTLIKMPKDIKSFICLASILIKL